MYQPARSLCAAIGFSIAALAGAALPSQALATPAGVTESKYAAMVMDAATGEVLYAHNAEARRYPASITKVMTLYLAFEALSNGRLHLDDTVYVSAHAASMSPTKLGVPAGGSVTVDEAIRAMTVHSANDMAVALAEKLGGSEAKFTALMTLRAQELGMTNTHYVSACGLPDARQVTSAHDLAILARALMRDYPQYYGYFSLKSFSYHGRTMVNTNHLLNDMPGVDGIKTGFTNASGFNLAASAVRDNHRLIVVVLGGSSSSGRNRQVENLLDTGFSVMHRRDSGEKIAVAQNVFEPGSAPEATEAAAKVVLTDSEVASLRAAETPVKKAETQQTAETHIVSPAQARLIRVKADEDGDRRSRHGHGEWRVQVGSYRLKSQAEAQLAAVEHRYGEAVEGTHGTVREAGRHAYNVRFSGFSATAAKDACHLMRSHRQACVAMPPES